MAQSRHNVSVSSLSNTITEFSSGLFSPVQSSSLLLGLSCPDPVLHSRSYWKNLEEKPSHLRAAVPGVPPPHLQNFGLAAIRSGPPFTESSQAQNPASQNSSAPVGILLTQRI